MVGSGHGRLADGNRQHPFDHPLLRSSGQILTFFVTGGAAALLYVVLAALLKMGGLQPWLASILAYGAVIPIAYMAQRTLTFRAVTPHRHAFPRYAATQLIGLSLSAGISAIVFNIGQFNPFFGFAIVGAFVTVLNYLLLKFWAFRPR